MKQIDVALAQLAAKEIRFGTFAAETRPYWESQATKLLKRWVHPPDLGLEDLVQEMLITVWECIDKHDPAKADLKRYVCFNAIARAAKVLHTARKAPRRSGRARGRFEANFSSFQREDAGDDWMETLIGGHDPTGPVEAAIDGNRAVEKAIPESSVRDAHALAALKLSSFDPCAAAMMLFDDRYCRSKFRLRSSRHAARMVQSAVASL